LAYQIWEIKNYLQVLVVTIQTTHPALKFGNYGVSYQNLRDKIKPVSTEKLANSNMFQQEAIGRLLEKKGLITRGELLEYIR